jgi:hypothetical protein
MSDRYCGTAWVHFVFSIVGTEEVSKRITALVSCVCRPGHGRNLGKSSAVDMKKTPPSLIPTEHHITETAPTIPEGDDVGVQSSCRVSILCLASLLFASSPTVVLLWRRIWTGCLRNWMR